jgi:predicted ATPase
MAAAVARHDALLRQTIERHQGVVFKTIGDAFCAAFPVARDAMLAALEAQRSLVTEPWTGVEPLRVRMALNTGAAELRDRDYFGPPLNRVARILNAAHGGQILLTQVTHDLVQDDLAADAFLIDLGEHRLRGIERPKRVWQLGAHGLVIDFPALRTSSVRLNNLPALRTGLIGRAAEVEALEQLLERDTVSVVTFTGPGGTGKSRLALEMAHRLEPRYEHGVCFVPLAAVRDADLVPITIGSALGIPESAGLSPLEGVLSYFDQKRMLLVLDNFEQVVDSAPVIMQMLHGAPGLKIIVTSRSSLRISGEIEFPVAPLPAPVSVGNSAPDDVLRYPSVSLFVDRAATARPGFHLDESNAAAIAEICRRLDGLPLAIELAAARVKVLSPQAMLSRLDHRLSLLTGGARDLPERQQTLRAAIAWSHDLLSEDERGWFRRLSVFSGGCSLEAAEAVCGIESSDADMVDVLSSLIDKSLVRQDDTGEEGRFGMLETIREFALEELSTAGEQDVRQRHADYFLALAEEANRALHGPRQSEWLGRLASEHANIRVALETYRESGDHLKLARLLNAFWWFWYLRNYVYEGRRWIDETLLLINPAQEPRAYAELLVASSTLGLLQADFHKSEQKLTQAREMALELDDPVLAARALSSRGQALGFHGDYSEVEAMLAQAEREQRALGDRWGLGLTLFFRAMAAWVHLDRDGAERMAAESLQLFQAIGDSWGAGLSPGVLARLDIEDGRYDLAREHLNHAMVRWTQAGDRWGLGHMLTTFGDIARLEGNYLEAEAKYEESFGLFREFANKNGMASGYHNLGYTRLHDGDVRSARSNFRTSLDLFLSMGDRRGVLEAVAGLAAVAAFSGDAERAARWLGAVEFELDALGVRISSSNRRDYALAVERIQRAFTNDALENAWDRGRRLTFEQLMGETSQTAS